MIYATNFSLGMALVKQILEKLSQAKNIPTHQISIHEVHHLQKDAPSGTALSMEKWIGENAI